MVVLRASLPATAVDSGPPPEMFSIPSIACNVSDYTCDKHTKARPQDKRGCRVAAALDLLHSLADSALQAL